MMLNKWSSMDARIKILLMHTSLLFLRLNKSDAFIQPTGTTTLSKSSLLPFQKQQANKYSYHNAYYNKRRQTLLPLHAIAPQTLKDTRFEKAEKKEKELFEAIQKFKDGTSNSSGEIENSITKKPSIETFTSIVEAWLAFPMPDRAENVIDNMEEMYDVSGRLYERVINAWSFKASESSINSERSMPISKEKKNNASSSGTIAAQRAIQLLNRMDQLYHSSGDVDLRPALSTYTSVINAIKRTTEKGLSETTTEEMINQIRNRRDEIYHVTSDLDKLRFIVPIQVFDVLKYLEHGDEIGKRLRKGKEKNGIKAPILNRYNFKIIINALATERKPWASQAAEDILDCMIKFHTTTHPRLRPNIETINVVMNACAQCDDTESPSRAEGILKKLNDLQTTDGLLLDVTPNTVSYNSIVKAYANNGNAKKAEEVLHIMEELYKSTNDEKIRPDHISFSSVLHAYARAARYDQSAANTAEKILMRMVKEQKARVEKGIKDDPIVNVWCFNAVLNAYAAQGAGLRAILVLKLMEDMADRDGNDSVRPDRYSYNTVLKALANSKEKGSIGKALQILDTMEEMSAKGYLDIKPDGISYNTVILAYANHGGRGAGNSAERIVKRMENQFFNGHKESKPTSATYTSLIKVWTSEKGSTRRAEEIVNKLKKSSLVGLDTSIYNALLNCYAKSGERGAAKRAEEIIKSMLKDYTDTGDNRIKPNYRTYTTTIDVYSKSREKGIEVRALGMLEQMERLYDEGETSLSPNVYTYAAVINCIARSKEPDKAVKAVSLLQQMEEKYRSGNRNARPNIVVYNSVLNACAYTYGRKEDIETAFKIACLVFDEIRSSDYVRPTHVTYAAFIQICGALMPDSEIRDNLVEATFKRCARDGLVSQLVLKKLRHRGSSSLSRSLLRDAGHGDNEAKWSRNT
mmetsp:Transcript_9236/g.11643  ORF Transcript_9236/g.11643 Transcript_9236/m.11643 type:complete len:919 (+) Transcript_9236:141-2897(+)